MIVTFRKVGWPLNEGANRASERWLRANLRITPRNAHSNADSSERVTHEIPVAMATHEESAWGTHLKKPSE